MLIATAGHVDHGKTTLLYHLTKTHTAHLPEEKKRGLTIDLGFAYLKYPGKPTLGFVDVPGHERFISNMLAGINALDVGLLVIACDDGVMPQTLEHLTILDLLELKHLFIVLTKTDLVPAAQVTALRQAVTTLIKSRSFSQCHYFATNPTQADQYTAILNELYLIAATKPQQNQQPQAARLCIDRIFSKHGLGTIVTGTILNGTIDLEAPLYFYPQNSAHGIKTRVKQIHAMNTQSPQGQQGMRVALNLAALDHKFINRGDWLFSTPQTPSDLIDGHYHGQPLDQWQRVTIHHGTQHQEARIGQLDRQSILIRLHLPEVLYTALNDKIIIRDAQGIHTLGVLTVLNPYGPKRKARSNAYLAQLKRRINTPPQELLLKELNTGPINITQFAKQAFLDPMGLVAHLDAQNCIQIPSKTDRWAITQSVLDRDLTQFTQALIAFHTRYPDEVGVTVERFRRMNFLQYPLAVYLFLKDHLVKNQNVIFLNGFIRHQSFTVTLKTEELQLWHKTHAIMAQGFDWWVRDMAKILELEEHRCRSLMIKFARQGYIVPIIKDRYFLYEHYSRCCSTITTLVNNEGQITAAHLRDKLTIGRKLAIQILEQLDKKGLIRRVKDHYVLRAPLDI